MNRINEDVSELFLQSQTGYVADIVKSSRHGVDDGRQRMTFYRALLLCV